MGNAYGQGLYALAKEENLEKQILDELLLLEACFEEQPEFLKLLESNQIPKAERIEILNNGFREQVHLYVLNFLKLLTEKGYIRHFSACCKVYKALFYKDRGILEVRVTSAIPLKEDQKQRLTDKLSGITGKQISLNCRENPAVLGGIRLNFDGMQVDGTVQGRLQAVENSLKNTVL